MHIEHKEAEKRVMVSQLENDLIYGTFSFTYNGTKMLAKLSLHGDGDETMIPQKADDDDKATIIMIAAVMFVIHHYIDHFCYSNYMLHKNDQRTSCKGIKKR